MSRLRITLLGAFQATLDGKNLSAFGTDKARALLAYLVVEAHRPHRREHLAGLLWSDQTEKKALHSLRQSLSTLRKLLIEDQDHHPFLLVNRDTVQFNLESDHWLDTADFKLALERGLPQSRQGQVQQRSNIRRLQYALSLYQGNFLDQFILKGSPLFDEWAIIQREILTRQAIETMCILIDYHEHRGEFEQACKIAEKIVSLIPWDENAHQVVMRMLAQAGQWSAVEVQYQNMQRYLADELGVEPSPETSTLLEEIRTSARTNTALAPRYSNYPHNLPLEPTPFVGRENEMIELGDLLAIPKSQCITLTGTGGIGKSRLALAVAREQIGLFENGVFFVPLVSINSAELLTISIAEAIGFTFYSSQDPKVLLVDHLRQKHMLLVLDNFEHLLTSAHQAVELLTKILTTAPGIMILVTSRQPLNLRIEQIFEVQGLSYPTREDAFNLDQHEYLKNYSAVQLFNQVARRVNPKFSLNLDWNQVAKICQLIEGLPLAIELSATWVRGYELPEIASQIKQDLDFLATTMRDVPDRHRSIRSVFNHSWQLLSDVEKSILHKLTVFKGSFSRTAAEVITGATANQIFSLIDQSLLHRIEKDRYEIHNLLRQFAAEILAKETTLCQITQESHSIYYAKLIKNQEVALYGSNPLEAQKIISMDIENIRASWHWASEYSQITPLLLAAKGLGRYYDMRSWFSEGREVFARAAKSFDEKAKPIEENLGIFAAIITQQGWYEVQLGNYQAAISLIEDIIPELRSNYFPSELSAALNTLGSAVYELGDLDKAKSFFEESLNTATEAKDLGKMAFAYNYLGNIARIQGEFRLAMQWFNNSLDCYQHVGDKWGLAKALNNLGNMAGVSGNYSEAARYFQESLSIRRELEDQAGIAGCLHNLSNIAYIDKDYAKTKLLRLECLSICREIGFTWGITSTLKHLGDVDKELEDFSQAKKNYLESLEISENAGDRRSTAFTLTSLGNLALREGDYIETKQYILNALKIAQALELTPLIIDILVEIANLWLVEKQYEQAYHLLSETLIQPGIEKQTQEKGNQIRNQIESRISAPMIEQINARNEIKSLQAITNEILETLKP